MREEGANLLWETKTKEQRILLGYDVHDGRLINEEATLDAGTWYKTKIIPRKLDQDLHFPCNDLRIEGTHYPREDHPEHNSFGFYFYTLTYDGFSTPNPNHQLRLYRGFNKRPLWSKTFGEIEASSGVIISQTARYIVLGNDTLVIYQLDFDDYNDTDGIIPGFILFVDTAGNVTKFTSAQITSAVPATVSSISCPSITRNAFWVLAHAGNRYLVRIAPSGINTELIPSSSNLRPSICGIRDRINFFYHKPESGFGADHEGVFVRQYTEDSAITPIGGEITIRPTSWGESGSFGREEFEPMIYSSGIAIIPLEFAGNVIRFRHDGVILTDLIAYPDGEPFSNYGRPDQNFANPVGTVIDIDSQGYKFVIDDYYQGIINRITPGGGDDYQYDIPRVAIKDSNDNLQYRLRVPHNANLGLGLYFPWYRFTEKLLMIPSYVRVNPPAINGLPPSMPSEINRPELLPTVTFDFYDLKLGFRYTTILFPKVLHYFFIKHPQFFDTT